MARAWRDTLAALCAVLRDRPALRGRLDDGSRMRPLCAELNHGAMRSHHVGDGLGWDSTDIHHALRTLGYVHPYGRPLEGEPMPSLASVIDAVEGRLEKNPYRGDRANDRTHIERIARDDYLDVEPWPFAALTRD